MPKVKCPQCATIVTYAAGYEPICPQCGFRGGAPAPVPAAAPPTWSGFSQPPTDPVPPPGQSANGMAIASLVCGCAAFVVGITAPIAIILGIIALNQKPDAGARTMAIIGIVIGALFTVGFLVFLFFMAAMFGAM